MSLTYYVWFDALLSYYTAVGYGDDGLEATAMRKRFWPAQCTLSVGHHPLPLRVAAMLMALSEAVPQAHLCSRLLERPQLEPALRKMK